MSHTYTLEEQVKNALNIDSFRNISKEKILEFVSLIPSMDKDLALSIINQFPTYSDTAKFMIDKLSEDCEKALASNDLGQRPLYESCQKTLDYLGICLNKENLTPEDRDIITNKMITVLQIMKEKDSENKQFISWVLKNKTYITGVAIVIGAAILGVNVKSKDIPHLLKK